MSTLKKVKGWMNKHNHPFIQHIYDSPLCTRQSTKHTGNKAVTKIESVPTLLELRLPRTMSGT